MRSRTASQQQQASMHGPNPMVRSEPQKALATLDRGPPSSIGRAHSRLIALRPCPPPHVPPRACVRAGGRRVSAPSSSARRSTRHARYGRRSVRRDFFVFCFFFCRGQASYDRYGRRAPWDRDGGEGTYGRRPRTPDHAGDPPSIIIIHARRSLASSFLEFSSLHPGREMHVWRSMD